jgi:hypothetical protein
MMLIIGKRFAKETYPKVPKRLGLDLPRGAHPEVDGEQNAEDDAGPEEDLREVAIHAVGENRGEQAARDTGGQRDSRANRDAIEP